MGTTTCIISEGKEKVIVLDFVSDIRRFAAGLNLKDELRIDSGPSPGKPVTISLKHKVTFNRVGGEDPVTEIFLRQWLEDIATVENSGEDVSGVWRPVGIPVLFNYCGGYHYHTADSFCDEPGIGRLPAVESGRVVCTAVSQAS